MQTLCGADCGLERGHPQLAPVHEHGGVLRDGHEREVHDRGGHAATLRSYANKFLMDTSSPIVQTRNILVAEWIHFTLLGIILPTIKLKVYTLWFGAYELSN